MRDRQLVHRIIIVTLAALLGLPVLARAETSPADADSWYLMRGDASLEERQKSEDAFYGSDDWEKGPREAILAAIDTYATIVIHVDEATLLGLRKAGVR